MSEPHAPEPSSAAAGQEPLAVVDAPATPPATPEVSKPPPLEPVSNPASSEGEELKRSGDHDDHEQQQQPQEQPAADQDSESADPPTPPAASSPSNSNSQASPIPAPPRVPPPVAVPAPSLVRARAEADYWRRIEAEHDRLDRHADRVNVVSQEIQRVLALSEQEKLHWRKQYDRIAAMERRMQTACRTAHKLHHTLQQTTQLIHQLSSQLATGFDENPTGKKGKKKATAAEAAKASSLAGSLDSAAADEEMQETGTLRQACIAQEILLRTTGQYLEEMLTRVFRSASQQSQELLVHTRARAAEQHSTASGIFQEQKQARERAAGAWRQYMQASEERQRHTLMNTALTEDPYLACREYARAMSQLSSMDTRYRQTMAEVLMQLKVDDGRRIAALQAIMLDVLLGQRSVLEHSLKFTNSTIATVKAIDRDADVAEFLEMADLVHPVDQQQQQQQQSRGPAISSRSPVSASSVPAAQGKPQPQQQQQAGKKAATPLSSASAGIQGMTVFEARPPQLDYGVVSRLYTQEVDHEGPLGRPGGFLSSRWKDVRAVVSSSGFLHYFEAAEHLTQDRPSFSLSLHDCLVRRCPTADALAFEIEAPNKSWMSLSGAPVLHQFRAGSDDQLATWMAVLERHTMREQPAQSPDAASGGQQQQEQPQQQQ